MLKQYSLLLWTRCYYAPSYRWGNLSKQILTYLCKISNLEYDGHQNSFSLQLPNCSQCSRNLELSIFKFLFFLSWLIPTQLYFSQCMWSSRQWLLLLLCPKTRFHFHHKRVPALFIYSSNILFQRETLLKKSLKCFNHFWRKEVMKCQVRAIKLNSLVNLFSHLVERIRKRTHPSLSKFYWNRYLLSTVLSTCFTEDNKVSVQIF